MGIKGDKYHTHFPLAKGRKHTGQLQQGSDRGGIGIGTGIKFSSQGAQTVIICADDYVAAIPAGGYADYVVADISGAVEGLNEGIET